MGSFDIQAIVTRAFDVFKENIGLLLGLTIGGMVVGQIFNFMGAGAQMITMIAGEELGSDMRDIAMFVGIAVRLFFSVVLFIFNSYFGLAMIKVSLRLVRGDSATFKDAIIDFPTFLQGVLASFLLNLAVGVGSLLCLVPGVMLALGLGLSLYLVVDQKKSAIDALKDCWAMTDGAKMNLLVWYIAAAVMGFVGLLACGVGIFVAAPVIMLGTAIVYEQLAANNSASPLDITK